MSLDAVLFDLDGTLLDSHEAVIASLRAATDGLPGAEKAWSAVDHDALMRMRPPEMMEVLVPGHAALASSRYDEHYLQHSGASVRLFPETLALLDGLAAAGIPVGLVTNKSMLRVERDVANVGMEWSRFSVVVTADDSVERKPSPVPLQLAASRAGWEGLAVAYVGDAPQDVEAARAAGMWSVAIAQGYYSRESLAASSPGVIVADAKEALAALLRRQGEAS